MDKALYIAMTGAASSLRAQTAVSHNIANASTPGFKGETFSTEPYAVKGDGYQSRRATMLQDRGFMATPGVIQTTNNPLDVAVRGQGWIAVQDKSGNEAYTRAGALQITPNGQLVDREGRPVLGEGGPIVVPPYQSLLIGDDGTVSIVPQGQSPTTISNVGRIRVIEAPTRSFQRGDDGLFRLTPNSTPQPVAGQSLIVGALEGSNVNAAESMVNMISLSRQFEMQVKVIRTAEENARAATSLLRVD